MLSDDAQSRRLYCNLEQRIQTWQTRLDTADAELCRLWDAAIDGRLHRPGVICWGAAQRAQESCRAVLREALLNPDPSLFDNAFMSYAAPLQRHQDVERAWRTTLQELTEQTECTWEETHEGWASAAETVLRAGGPWQKFPTWMDQPLKDTEHAYREMETYGDTVRYLDTALREHGLTTLRPLVESVDAALRAAAVRQDQVRRLRLPPHCGEPIGWDNDGLPRFNEPRPPREPSAVRSGSMRPVRGTGPRSRR